MLKQGQGREDVNSLYAEGPSKNKNSSLIEMAPPRATKRCHTPSWGSLTAVLFGMACFWALQTRSKAQSSKVSHVFGGRWRSRGRVDVWEDHPDWWKLSDGYFNACSICVG